MQVKNKNSGVLQVGVKIMFDIFIKHDQLSLEIS